MVRTSTVGAVRVLNTQFSSILQFGDSVVLSPRSEVLAVQRQEARYWGNEGNFDQFPIYRQNIPEPLLDESVVFSTRNDNPTIQVGFVNIMAFSVSGVLHVGSVKVVDTENRTHHVRQLLSGARPVR